MRSWNVDRGRIAAIAAVAATLLAVALTGLIAFALPDSRDHARTAVIVDQLAMTDPNPEFIGSVRTTLEDAGYRVDYIPADRVSVEFYRLLPSFGYDYIVLRSHSLQEVYGAALDAAGARIPVAEVGIFTNELYDRGLHLDDQTHDRLTVGEYPDRAERYFAIAPEFVRHTMKGRFGGATLVLLGCGGLNSDGMAQALVGRGVSSVVSWDDRVTSAHNDLAGAALIQHLIADHLPPPDAIARTMTDVGPDPTFGSSLAVFP